MAKLRWEWKANQKSGDLEDIEVEIAPFYGINRVPGMLLDFVWILEMGSKQIFKDDSDEK